MKQGGFDGKAMGTSWENHGNIKHMGNPRIDLGDEGL